MPRVKVNLDRVYYPGRDRRNLYINTKKKYERTAPLRHGNIIAPRVCSRRCSVILNGHQCKRHTCLDYNYCWQHLAIKKHLFIAPSRRLKKLGIPGDPLGLYAVKNLKALKDSGKEQSGAPVKTREIVFKEGDIIGSYGGESIDIDERYPDPDDKETATYAVTAADGTVYDGLAAAGAISYSNEVIDVKSLMKRHNTKSAFIKAYNAKVLESYGKANMDVANTGGGMIKFKAIRPVYHGEELLWSYGADYWSTEGMKYYLTGTGWS